MRLEFLVRRKGIDATAETCLEALQGLMGLAVERVEHGKLWRFELEGDGERAQRKEEIARAACRAGRYVNTNRDVYAWLDESAAAAVVPPGHSATDLWIREGEGNDPVAQAYFAAKLGARLLHLQHGTLYRLWAPLADPAAARAFALEVAVSKSRRQGLLMNPHSQTLEVLRVWRHESREEGRY